MTYILYGSRFANIKKRATSITAALVLAFTSMSGAFPLLASRTASAITPSTTFSQGFESNTNGWYDGGDYGAITRVASGTNGINAESGGWYATVSSTDSGPYTKFDGYRDTWTGTWNSEIGVYLDPSWADGTGFDYSVASSKSNGDHLRDFIFHVAKDASTNSLLVAASNNTNFTVPTNLETLNHYTVTTAGWYTLQTVFRDQAGSLAVDLNLLNSSGTVVFTETRNTASDTIPAVVGGNRYGWFTVANVAGGVAIDNSELHVYVPPTVSACTTTGNVVTTNLSNWNLSETRATGHNQLLADGLHVWTEGTTSTDKAAGYYAVDFPLADTGNQTIAQSIEYDASFGITPGLQLVVDFDHDGTPDGILVGESVYGNDWWLSNSAAQFVKDGAPNSGGGYGSQWHGTLNEWLFEFPDAQVQAIGYSLGSGVHGDGVIKRITLGCNNYTFGLAAPTLVYPANNSFINTNNFWFDWGDVNSAAGYEFQASQSPSVDGNGSLNVGVWTGDYQHNQPTASTLHSVGASGTWYWQVRAVDGSGGKGPWSNVWKMTIDTGAPSVPSITAPTNGQYFNSTPILNSWTTSTDSISGISHYQIAYHYDDGHSFGSSTCPSLTISGYSGFIGCRDVNGTSRNHMPSSSEQGGVTIWVRAVDNAGNMSAWSTPVHYFFDSVAPAKPTLVSPANNSVVNGASITQAWSDSSSDVDHYIYESYNDAGATSLRWHEEFAGTSKTATNVGTATYWWRVRAVDAAGNESAWSDLWKITVDNTAPTVPEVTAPSAGDYLNGSSTLNQWTTSTDANGVVLYEVKYELTTGTQYRTTTSTSRTQTFSGSYQGPITISVRAKDAAGNWSAYGTPVTYYYDSVDPVVNVDPLVTTDATPTLTGTVTDNSPINSLLVKVNGNTYAATVAGGTWSVDVTDALSAGTYDVSATATDAAGNVGADTTTNELTVNEASPLTTQPTFVLGANTNTPNTPSGNSSSNQGSGTEDSTTEDSNTGEVKGAETTKTLTNDNTKSDTTSNSRFLGLGWWWLLILALVLGFLWFLLGRRNERSDK